MGDMQEVTVAQIASAVAVSEEDILATLVAAGFAVASGETTLGQLSEQQGVSPQEVLDTLREGHPNARGWGRITGQRGGGWH
jgi:hypothetical protein